jgi:hypothetical protein
MEAQESGPSGHPYLNDPSHIAAQKRNGERGEGEYLCRIRFEKVESETV